MPESVPTAQQATEREALPARLNLSLALLAGGLWVACLVIASRGPWWAMGGAALLFALVTNHLYALQHEALHGLFHPRRWLNELGGLLLAATTPIGFSIQRSFHLKHHRGNRGDEECFDLVLPGDSSMLKRLQFYGILSGEFWAHLPLVSLVWLVCPWGLRSRWLRDRSRQEVRQHGADAFLSAMERLPPWRSRLEVLVIIVVHVVVCWLGSVTIIGWCLCYGAFAFSWGGMQYATHAYSERSIRHGAWNLRCPRWISALLCHYPLHLAHHEHPAEPWTALPRLATGVADQPSLAGQWYRMWRTGPVVSHAAPPSPVPRDPLDFMERELPARS